MFTGSAAQPLRTYGPSPAASAVPAVVRRNCLRLCIVSSSSLPSLGGAMIPPARRRRGELRDETAYDVHQAVGADRLLEVADRAGLQGLVGDVVVRGEEDHRDMAGERVGLERGRKLV